MAGLGTSVRDKRRGSRGAGLHAENTTRGRFVLTLPVECTNRAKSEPDLNKPTDGKASPRIESSLGSSVQSN